MNPDDANNLAQSFLGSVVVLPSWAIWLLILCVFAFGAFARSYLAQRAKSFASRQDLDEISRQLSHTTAVSEQVRAEISSGLWLNQKIWEFRREIYTELLRNLYELQSTLFDLICMGQSIVEDSSRRERLETLKKRRMETKEAIRYIAGTASLVLPQVRLDVVHNLYGDLLRSPDKFEEFDFDEFDAELAQVESAYEYFVEAGREDLGVKIGASA